MATKTTAGTPAIYERAAARALAAYGPVVDGWSLEPLTFVNNGTFAVRTERDRYALRVSRPGFRSREQLASELAWLLALRQAPALRVPEPVAAEDGRLIVEVRLPGWEQPFDCVLFAWLSGRHLRTHEQTGRHAFAIGKFTAELHARTLAQPAGRALKRRRLDWVFFEKQLRLIAFAGADWLFDRGRMAQFERLLARSRPVWDELAGRADSVGLIHGDLIWKNILFDEGRVGAIDFDDCGYGLLLYDLAPLLSGYRDEVHYDELRAALLAGYRSARALPVGDERHLDVLIALRHLVSCGWLAERLDDPALRERAERIVAYRVGEVQQLLDGE